MSAANHPNLQSHRRTWIARTQPAQDDYDTAPSPTVPLVAPPIAELQSDEANFCLVSALRLRNRMLVNVLDGRSISLPCHACSTARVGLNA